MVIKNKLVNFLFIHLCGAYIFRALSMKIEKQAQKGTGHYLRKCMSVLINSTQEFQIMKVVKLLAIIVKSKTKNPLYIESKKKLDKIIKDDKKCVELIEKFKEWDDENSEEDKLYNQFHKKSATLKDSCAYNKKINDLVTKIKLPTPRRGEQKNPYYCPKLWKHLERHYLYLIPLWTGLMLSPERYCTEFLGEKRKEKIAASVNRATTSSIESFFGYSKTAILRFVYKRRTTLKEYVSKLSNKMVLAYKAYKLNMVEMESKKSKNLGKSKGRKIKTSNYHKESDSDTESSKNCNINKDGSSGSSSEKINASSASSEEMLYTYEEKFKTSSQCEKRRTRTPKFFSPNTTKRFKTESSPSPVESSRGSVSDIIDQDEDYLEKYKWERTKKNSEGDKTDYPEKGETEKHEQGHLLVEDNEECMEQTCTSSPPLPTKRNLSSPEVDESLPKKQPTPKKLQSDGTKSKKIKKNKKSKPLKKNTEEDVKINEERVKHNIKKKTGKQHKTDKELKHNSRVYENVESEKVVASKTEENGSLASDNEEVKEKSKTHSKKRKLTFSEVDEATKVIPTTSGKPQAGVKKRKTNTEKDIDKPAKKLETRKKSKVPKQVNKKNGKIAKQNKTETTENMKKKTTSQNKTDEELEYNPNTTYENIRYNPNTRYENVSSLLKDYQDGDQVAYKNTTTEHCLESLKKRQVMDLDTKQWVGSEIINVWYSILNDYVEETYGNGIAYFFTVDWFASLKMSEDGHWDKALVKKVRDLTLWKYKLWVVPIHMDATHYATMVVNFQPIDSSENQRLCDIHYIDSYPIDREKFRPYHLDLFLAFLKDLYQRVTWKDDFIETIKSNIRIYDILEVDQGNGYDCGVYVCLIAYALAHHDTVKLNAKTCVNFRKYVAKRLMNSNDEDAENLKFMLRESTEDYLRKNKSHGVKNKEETINTDLEAKKDENEKNQSATTKSDKPEEDKENHVTDNNKIQNNLNEEGKANETEETDNRDIIETYKGTRTDNQRAADRKRQLFNKKMLKPLNEKIEYYLGSVLFNFGEAHFLPEGVLEEEPDGIE